MKLNTRSLTRAAIIAALYLLLTFALQAISFGAVQFRIAEALMLLPVLTVDAVPGLFIGCLLGNLLGGGVWYDVILGSIATLLAAVAVRRLRERPLLAAAMPTIPGTFSVPARFIRSCCPPSSSEGRYCPFFR